MYLKNNRFQMSEKKPIFFASILWRHGRSAVWRCEAKKKELMRAEQQKKNERKKVTKRLNRPSSCRICAPPQWTFKWMSFMEASLLLHRCLLVVVVGECASDDDDGKKVKHIYHIRVCGVVLRKDNKVNVCIWSTHIRKKRKRKA